MVAQRRRPRRTSRCSTSVPDSSRSRFGALRRRVDALRFLISQRHFRSILITRSNYQPLGWPGGRRRDDAAVSFQPAGAGRSHGDFDDRIVWPPGNSGCSERRRLQSCFAAAPLADTGRSGPTRPTSWCRLTASRSWGLRAAAFFGRAAAISGDRLGLGQPQRSAAGHSERQWFRAGVQHEQLLRLPCAARGRRYKPSHQSAGGGGDIGPG